MSDEIFNRIRKFIFEQGFGYTLPFPFLFKKKKITRETSIEKDLKIRGDDSDEFIIAFGKEFCVDVSQFPIGDYFGDEGDPVLPAIIRAVRGKKKKQKKKLTVGHLEKAIIARRLDEEIINS
jgi:acyl carrier protein